MPRPPADPSAPFDPSRGAPAWVAGVWVRPEPEPESTVNHLPCPRCPGSHHQPTSASIEGVVGSRPLTVYRCPRGHVVGHGFGAVAA